MKKTVYLTAVLFLLYLLLSTSFALADDFEITPDMVEQKDVDRQSSSEQAGFFCPYNSTIFGQPAHGPADVWSIGTSDKFSDYLIYDDFSGAGNITGLHFWGLTANLDGGWSPCSENPVEFGILFKEDDGGGFPGDMVTSRYVTIEGIPTGQFYAGFELYSYEVWFDEPVVIEEGWIGIYGSSMPEDCWFLWVSGIGGDSHSWQYTGTTPNDRYYDQGFCLLYEGCPEGVDVFGQPPDNPSSTSFRTATSDNGIAQQYCVYDNFTSLSHVGSIHFWGIQGHIDGTWLACSPAENPMNFEINFYTDNAGSPGALQYSFTRTLTGQPTGVIFWLFEIYEYQTQFPQIPMSSGWISIQGVDEPDCWYLAIGSRHGYDDHCYQWDGSTLADKPFDMAMCLMEICCVGGRGNVNCSDEEEPDISDITRLIDYLYITHSPLCCPEEADTNDSGGEPDISDITRLIDFLYISHAPMASCY